MKKIIATILATLTLTGCNVTNEKPVVNASDIINSVFENSTASTTTSTETPDETSTEASTVEDTTSTEAPTESTTESTPTESTPASTTTSKVENKPEAPASSTSTSKPAEKPASSSTTSKPSTPAASSTTTSTTKPAESTSKPFTPASSSTTTSTSKPAEKPAETTPKHNCSTDGHIWKSTYTTTEPKWCYDVHKIQRFGFDYDAAWDHFGTDVDVYQIFLDNMAALGIDADTGYSTYRVKVWGTETTQRDTCTVCGAIYEHSSTINPLGEWQFKDDHNPTSYPDGINFDTLFWDPYNVPQVVIDNLIRFWDYAYNYF